MELFFIYIKLIKLISQIRKKLVSSESVFFFTSPLERGGPYHTEPATLHRQIWPQLALLEEILVVASVF